MLLGNNADECLFTVYAEIAPRAPITQQAYVGLCVGVAAHRPCLCAVMRLRAVMRLGAVMCRGAYPGYIEVFFGGAAVPDIASRCGSKTVCSTPLGGVHVGLWTGIGSWGWEGGACLQAPLCLLLFWTECAGRAV